MEDLTNTQLMLLVLLITFVTSIATGIITFSLLSEAPVGVTQTINKVVERTIEKVVPVDVGSKETKVTTVVVTDEDLIVSGVNKLSQGVVRIYGTSTLESSQGYFFNLGVVATKSGIVVADKVGFTKDASYTAVFSDGKMYPLTQVSVPGEKLDLVFFKVVKNPSDKNQIPFVAFSSNDIKLGQTVVSLSGKDKDVVVVGRVFNLISEAVSASSSPMIVGVEADISLHDTILGTPIINLSGEVVGLRTGQIGSEKTVLYTPSKLINEEIAVAEKNSSQ